MQVLPRASIRVAFSARCKPTSVRRLSVSVMASKAPIYEIAVKGDAKTGILGDCPFSHRALLTLEEKSIPYTKNFVDLDNKPQWLLDVNPAGSVPVLKDLATDEWLPDSGAIADMLEIKFPEPKLGTTESSPQIGNAVFGAFKDFAKATPEEDSAKEAALLAALDEVEAHLQQTGGPYIGGAQPCATDLALMPKLYHLSVALDHFRGWTIPSKYTALKNYMDSYMGRDAWKNTHYSPELVIKGWVRHGIEVRK